MGLTGQTIDCLSVQEPKSIKQYLKQYPDIHFAYQWQNTRVQIGGRHHKFWAVWYNLRLLARILFIVAVCRKCCNMMDTCVEPAMCVHWTDRAFMRFKSYILGLYCHDLAKTLGREVAKEHLFLTTVSMN